MKFTLQTLALSVVASGFLALPSLASAHPTMVARADGSYQAAYSMRGHWMFINKVSRRHMRSRTLVERTMGKEWLQREII